MLVFNTPTLLLITAITSLHASPQKFPTILPYVREDVMTPQAKCTHVCPDSMRNNRVSKRINNGFPVTRADMVPWSARLKIWRNKKHANPPFSNLIEDIEEECTGSIVSARWILTAAHCVMRGNEKVGKKAIQVHVGGISKRDEDWPNQRSENFYKYKGLYVSDNWYTHPNSVKFAPNYDIALIRTSHEMIFNRMTKPACFTYTKIEDIRKDPETHFFISGWGDDATKRTNALQIMPTLFKPCERAEIVACETPDNRKKWKRIEDARDKHGGYCIAGKVNGMLLAGDGDSGGAYFATNRVQSSASGGGSICMSKILTILTHDLIELNGCGKNYVPYASMSHRFDGAQPKDYDWIFKTIKKYNNG